MIWLRNLWRPSQHIKWLLVRITWICCLLPPYFVMLTQSFDFVCLCDPYLDHVLLIVINHIEWVRHLCRSNQIRCGKISHDASLTFLALQSLNRYLVIKYTPEFWNRHSCTCVGLHTRDSVKEILTDVYRAWKLPLWVKDLLILVLHLSLQKVLRDPHHQGFTDLIADGIALNSLLDGRSLSQILISLL